MIPNRWKWRISAEKKHSFGEEPLFNLPSMGVGVGGSRLTKCGVRVIMGIKE